MTVLLRSWCVIIVIVTISVVPIKFILLMTGWLVYASDQSVDYNII